ncbi:MAG: hypothetical protein RJA45_639 [Actinomycetota bacterium]|jgi:hypothetical protein
MRRISILINVVSILLAWMFASQVWASTTVIESQTGLSVSGLDAYPQISFILLTGVLVLWLTRYLNSLFAKFLTTAVVILLFATASPTWFESASGSLSILSPQISKSTGVSDWLGQSELIQNSSYNHLSADLFVISLISWFISLLIILWSKKKGQKDTNLATRIDNLPSW